MSPRELTMAMLIPKCFRISHSVGSAERIVIRKYVVTKIPDRIKFTTWIVKIMSQAGKVNQAIKEMERMYKDIP